MKITVRMMGGLGNQLFNYAYARYLSELNLNLRIELDLRGYENFKLRKYELNQFKLNNSVFKLEKKKIFYYDFTRKFFYIFQGLYRLINKKPLKKGFKFMSKNIFLYSGTEAFNNLKLDRDTYLYGYFQDIKIVEPIREILIEEFRIKSEFSLLSQNYLKKIIESEISIGVSIRCGQDYLEQGWPICSFEYYRRGIEFLKNEHKTKKCKIFIFSDDIRKVKDKFKIFDDVFFIENCSAIESLELLKNCQNFVIANSSFAWWGAYLSDYKNKKVIIPKKWFKGMETKETSLIPNKEWIILD